MQGSPENPETAEVLHPSRCISKEDLEIHGGTAQTPQRCLRTTNVKESPKLRTPTALSKILHHNFSGAVNYQKYSSKLDFTCMMLHYVLLYLDLYVYMHTPPYVPRHVPHVIFLQTEDMWKACRKKTSAPLAAGQSKMT